MLLRKREEIDAQLNKFEIKDYELIENQKYGYVVDIYNDLSLWSRKLKHIEVKFNNINGCFDCSDNQLESLEGCPEIIYGNFNCSHNQLESLKSCPKQIKGIFYCSHNQLKTLEGFPEMISSSVYCNNNQLINLDYCAERIEGNFSCAKNKLKTLKNSPRIINGFINCSDNNLSIEGLRYLPKKVNENYINISNNTKLNKLQNIQNYTELKEKINIYFEKENLFSLIKNKNKKNNLNKI